MLTGFEFMGCHGLHVPGPILRHIVKVESSQNPFAIGVVDGQLERQPTTLAEALATVRALEEGGRNYSVGLAQINRRNFEAYGLDTPEKAFDACHNLRAGSRILDECYGRAGKHWARAFSCYYSGNFVTGFRDGYVQRVYTSMGMAAPAEGEPPFVPVINGQPPPPPAPMPASPSTGPADARLPGEHDPAFVF
jgi:type IV secretion system protein VirB1